MNMSSKNIFQRVAAITAELGAIAKDLTVGEGDKAYSATSEATILAAVKPLEEKHGVFSYAVSRTLDQKSSRSRICGTVSSVWSVWLWRR